VFVIAGISLVGLLIRELFARAPVIDLRIFREPTYTTGVFLMTMTGFVLYGSMVIFPILLQMLLQYPPLQAGIAMVPRGLGMLLMTPVVAILIGRVDPRLLMASGFAAGAVTLYWFSLLDTTAGYWEYFWPQIIQGASFNLLFVPITTATMDPISNESMGNATSIFNLMRNIGGSVGIASTQTMMARGRQRHTNILGAHVSPYDPLTQERLRQLQGAFTTQGADPVTALQRAQGTLWMAVQRQASILTFNDIFRLMGFIMVTFVPVCYLMRRPRGKPSVPVSE
jgi:DHA2 family multidrug resistance protein